MLDPREQAKGGFRAQVARQNERQEQLARAAEAEHAAADGPLPDGTPMPAEDQADGAAVIGPQPQVQLEPTRATEARPVTRWR